MLQQMSEQNRHGRGKDEPACSLERHYRNMVGNKREYTIEINGHRADGFLCSIDEALTARQWDFVTHQQASPLSYLIDSYEPYMQR